MNVSEIKERGNQAFKEKDYANARTIYKEAINAAKSFHRSSDVKVLISISIFILWLGSPTLLPPS